MNLSEYRHHQTEAARLRSAAASTTTPALRARLLEEAQKHEQLARGERSITDEPKIQPSGNRDLK
jgi:hypothetical protein